MQILESSVLGLRAACLTFRASDGETEVALFPMVHIADAQFFELTYADALTSEIVLVEGF